jgi:homoserine dehydrogenase
LTRTGPTADNAEFAMPSPSRDETAPPEPSCRVALLGFGTVGRAAARILTEQPPRGVRLTHIFNRDVARKRVDWVPGDVTWTSDIEEIFAAPVDIVVEVVGGLDPAGTWVERALGSGRSVVTANKQLIAARGADLLALAERRGVRLLFEASVAGGIPILAALRDGLAGDRITRVTGILNGTCNFILTSMEEQGAPFTASLAEAQVRGYAEADPTDDVQGYDARAKLAILCAAALRARVAPTAITARPITAVDAVDFLHARQLGCTIRQVSEAAWADDGSMLASVRPVLVARDAPLARVSGSRNIVVVEGAYGGETVFSGFGAGGGPTSVAVVSDIAVVARSLRRGVAAARQAAALVDAAPHAVLADRADRVAEVTPAVSDGFFTPHYLRFVVRDRTGIIAAIAGVMERHGINIDAVLQLPAPSKDKLPFVVTVEACTPAVLADALREIGEMDFHVQPTVDLPILSGRSAA